MGHILKPRLGLRLNHNHPLSQGLVGCWVMNEGTGDKVYDATHGYIGSINSMFWGVGCLYQLSKSSQVITLPATYKKLDGGSAFTVCIKLRTDDLSADNEIFATGNHNTNEPFILWLDAATTNHVAILITTSMGSTSALYSDFVPSLNTWYEICLVWGNGVLRLYIDGREDTGGDFPYNISGTLESTTNDYRFCNSTGGNKPLVGWIKNALIYTKALSSSEIAQLHAEPYAMFEPDTGIWLRYYEAGGGLSIPVAMSHYLRQMGA